MKLFMTLPVIIVSVISCVFFTIVGFVMLITKQNMSAGIKITSLVLGIILVITYIIFAVVVLTK